MASSLNIFYNILFYTTLSKTKSRKTYIYFFVGFSNVSVSFQILLLLYRNFHRLTLNQIKKLILISMNMHKKLQYMQQKTVMISYNDILAPVLLTILRSKSYTAIRKSQ